MRHSTAKIFVKMKGGAYIFQIETQRFNNILT